MRPDGKDKNEYWECPICQEDEISISNVHSKQTDTIVSNETFNQIETNSNFDTLKKLIKEKGFVFDSIHKKLIRIQVENKSQSVHAGKDIKAPVIQSNNTLHK